MKNIEAQGSSPCRGGEEGREAPLELFGPQREQPRLGPASSLAKLKADMGETIGFPTYIVLEIPEPMATKIRRFRKLFDKERSKLPAEITLSGSCGLGLISRGQNCDGIFALVDKAAAAKEPFEAAFKDKVECFSSSETYYLGLRNPEPFMQLHQALAESGIKFDLSPYPFMPHCTLKLHKRPQNDELFDLVFLKPPKGSFIIDAMSIYALPAPLKPQLLHTAKLGKGETSPQAH